MRVSYLLITMLVAVGALSGCTKIGADMVHRDRFDYTTAVADSWNEQVLLNIVRLRYNAWPVFVGIDQIVTAYTLEHSGTAKITGRRFSAENLTNDQLEAGWVGKFSERPTVLYKPMSGKKYVNALLTPAKPTSILGLVESGWPADHLGRIAIRSVNEFYNNSAEFGVMHRTDPTFARFLTIFKQMQSKDAVKIRLTHPKEGVEQLSLVFIPERVGPELRAEFEDIKEALGLEAEKNTFVVVRDSLDNNPGEIRIEGRSILQVLVALAAGVEIPPEHEASGKAPPLQPIPEEEQTNFQPLMIVKSGAEKPERAFVSVRYDDMWFWIEDSDHLSKRSLLYALALITLLDTDDKAGGSVVIPVN